MIEIEKLNGRPSYRADSNDPMVLQQEMFGPFVLPWVKYGDDVPAPGIFGIGPIAFAEIASWTGQGEIGFVVGAAPGFRNDMLDMKGRTLQVLVHSTVFAPVPSPAMNLGNQRLRPTHRGLRSRTRRALARSRARTSLISTKDSKSLFS